MDPVLVAATFGDWSDAGIHLEAGRALEAIALATEGGRESGREDRARTWQLGEELEVGQALAAASDLIVKSSDAVVEQAELREQGLTSKRVGSMTAWSVVSGTSALMSETRLSTTLA
jgi:hypothetical protein